MEEGEWLKILETENLKNRVSSLVSGSGGIITNGEPSGTAVSAGNALSNSSLFRESLVAGTLDYLGHNAPETLSALFRSSNILHNSLSGFVDPLANFDWQTQQAILSPIGIVNLYRQYFFELNTFLGSPIGHVWVSPGGSVELFEVTTRRTTTERQIRAFS